MLSNQFAFESTLLASLFFYFEGVQVSFVFANGPLELENERAGKGQLKATFGGACVRDVVVVVVVVIWSFLLEVGTQIGRLLLL